MRFKIYNKKEYAEKENELGPRIQYVDVRVDDKGVMGFREDECIVLSERSAEFMLGVCSDALSSIRKIVS